VTRPRRLTTVATEPLLVPRKAPPGDMHPPPPVEVPRPVVVQVAPPAAAPATDAAGNPVENLSPVRLRPRRVVVIK
ncbi:MAG TPA: hypothetical protein PLM52_18120, partial [Tabrizicola sp.]|nr:hypothetical protein [Tabrizicola sp.]